VLSECGGFGIDEMQRKKPWKHLLKVSHPADRKLFFCSTKMIIGNGKTTPFCESGWLQGVAPKDLVPSLFEIAR
jgi:hypothetical protein